VVFVDFDLAEMVQDVIHCETVTGGNPALLEQEPYAERKENKVDYSKIFGDHQQQPAEANSTPAKKSKTGSTPGEKEQKKAPKNDGEEKKKTPAKAKNSGATKTKTPSAKSVAESSPVGGKGVEHKVRILAQPATPYHLDVQSRGGGGASKSAESSPAGYTCHICGFAATRLNVIVLHSKTHSSASSGGGNRNSLAAAAVVASVRNSPGQKGVSGSQKKAEKERPFRDDRVTSTSSRKRDKPAAPTKLDRKSVNSDAAPAAKKPRLTKKQREERKEQERKKEEEKRKLLGDWSEDEHQEEEEYKKLQVTNFSASVAFVFRYIYRYCTGRYRCCCVPYCTGTDRLSIGTGSNSE
jgi:hypothetical protein